MHQAIKNVAKAPMIARYTWLAIMVAAMICADQWGVAQQQINHLLTIIYRGFTGVVSLYLLFRWCRQSVDYLVFDSDCSGVYGDAHRAHHQLVDAVSWAVYAVMVLLCAADP